ncbi:MAG: hypothetical protein AAGE37_08675 [Pseudomonadota bacterium]
MAKHDKKGRTIGARHSRLDHTITGSGAFRSLTPNGRVLLWELVRLENGKNNGELFLSVSDAALLMGCSDKKAAQRAFDELQRRGFIDCTRDAHFKIKAREGSRARTWRLTFLLWPDHSAPTNDYLDRQPDPSKIDEPKLRNLEQRALKRMQAGLKTQKKIKRQYDLNAQKIARVDSTPDSSIAREDSTPMPPQNGCKTEIIGEDSTPAKRKKPQKPVNTYRGGIDPPYIVPVGRSLSEQLTIEDSSVLREVVNRHILETRTTQRAIARHPSCCSTRLSEPKLSRFLNRENSTLPQNQAEALREAISSPSHNGKIIQLPAMGKEINL